MIWFLATIFVLIIAFAVVFGGVGALPAAGIILVTVVGIVVWVQLARRNRTP